jgi:hypothetical protein
LIGWNAAAPASTALPAPHTISVPVAAAALRTARIGDWWRNVVVATLICGALTLLFAAGLAAMSWALTPPKQTFVMGTFASDHQADYRAASSRVPAQRPGSTSSPASPAAR